MNINAETFNSIVNAIIYNYSIFLGLQEQDIYEKMKEFNTITNEKLKAHAESLQLSEDDVTSN